jgi:adenylate cyclase class 2
MIGIGMADRGVEIEVRFSLKNTDAVAGFLNANAEPVSGEVVQTDSYFTPQHRNFLGVKFPFEWLRLRETERGCSVTYKHFHPENVEKTDYCDEFETGVENIGALRKIFDALNFRVLVVVEKRRRRWAFRNTDVAIDDVKGLGSFIEVEALESFEDPKEGRKHLYSVLGDLGAEVGNEELHGYPYMLLEKAGRKS